jgi:ribosomal protein S16
VRELADRETQYLKILHSIGLFQAHIADLLESKVVEAEKVASWIKHGVKLSPKYSNEDLLKQGLDIHDGEIELIESLTLMERSLATHLNLLLKDEMDNDQSENETNYSGGLHK